MYYVHFLIWDLSCRICRKTGCSYWFVSQIQCMYLLCTHYPRFPSNPNVQGEIWFLSVIIFSTTMTLDANPISNLGQSFQKEKLWSYACTMLQPHLNSGNSCNQIIRLVVNWWRESGRTSTTIPRGSNWVILISFYYYVGMYHQIM